MANGDRVQRRAAIKRATRAAQRDMNKLDGETLGRLEGIYRQAREDIEERIRAAADSGGLLTQEVLAGVRERIDRRLEGLAGAQEELLDNGLERAAALGGRPFEGELDPADLSEIADGAVRHVRNFVDEDGIQLSDRVWRINRGAREDVARYVENAVARGSSASRTAREFLNRGEPVPDEIRQKMNSAQAERVARGAGRTLMVDDDNAYRDARRVFRTEINRAHGQAYRDSARESEDAVGVRFLLSPRHPRRDICDMHASVNRHGLGAGVYPFDSSPWPAHPNTLSYEEVVFDDEVTDDDKDGKQDRISWLNQQAPELQEAVLNSRRKRAALQMGWLIEGQIATPWKVLRERYRRQGLDLDELKPEPIAARNFRRQGKPISRQEAEDYVRETGVAEGVEYAVVRDNGTGEELFRKTSNQRAAVYFTQREVALMRDENRDIDLVHNHPSSSSLSLPDLEISALDGIGRVVAVGHDGSVHRAKARRNTGRVRSAHLRAENRAIARLRELLRQEVINADEANYLVGHVTNEALSRGGYTEYAVDVVGERLQAVLDRGVDVDGIADEIAKEID